MNALQLFYPGASVFEQASIIRTRLAGAKVRLYKLGFTPSFTSTLADLDAEQCDFNGYPAGGIAVPSWSAPSYGPGQSAFINGGLVNFVYGGGGSGGGNVVGGFYLVTADSVLWVVSQFPSGYPMQESGQGLPLAIGIGVGSG